MKPHSAPSRVAGSILRRTAARPAQCDGISGVLTVTDPAKFHEAFTRGIGSAKAFGFGCW